MMNTDIAQSTYAQMEEAASIVSSRSIKAQDAPSTGLLAPKRKKPTQEVSPNQEPAYRVAQYFNKFRQKRMEISRG